MLEELVRDQAREIFVEYMNKETDCLISIRNSYQSYQKKKEKQKYVEAVEAWIGKYSFHEWNPKMIKIINRGSEIEKKAWRYFSTGEQGKKLFIKFVQISYGSPGDAIRETMSFKALFTEFKIFFNERKEQFMEEIQEKNKSLVQPKKLTTRSHGGVANLLKVLTKTMTEQGSSIRSIAKVQYAVCMQAGIYIPEEFITDVLVAEAIINE